MVTIRNELPTDVAAREALLDRAFGQGRLRKTAERLREGRLPADGLSFVAAEDENVVGTVRLWPISIGAERQALLLGPLAVDDATRGLGIGGALMRRAIAAAQALKHSAVLLVGDAPYYGRFGFSTAKTGALWMPGPFERGRLLARELATGALDGAVGVIGALGQFAPVPEASASMEALCRNHNPAAVRRAA
jgi:predicted N-acetyltransferase YhbS